MALGSVLKEAGTSSSLKRLISNGLKRSEDVPPPKPDDWLRASGLADLCPREEALCARDKVIRYKRLEADSLVTFDHGSGLHWVMQNLILPEIGVLRGRWSCLKCGHLHGSYENKISRPSTCAKCGNNDRADGSYGGSDFLYVECHIANEEYRIKGHPDGFLQLPGMPGLGVLEVKSISPKGAWEVKQVPNMGHTVQVQTYLWLTSLTWAKIVYWDKGAYGVNCLIEHLVERDQETIEKIQGLALDIRRGVAGEFMPKRICAVVDCPRAKLCVVRAACFKE